MVLLRSSAFVLVLVGLVHADAVKPPVVTPLSPIQIASFSAFTNFASAGYCDPSTTATWTCGGASLAALSPAASSPDYPFLANCQANPDFLSVASGGDGASTQFCRA